MIVGNIQLMFTLPSIVVLTLHVWLLFKVWEKEEWLEFEQSLLQHQHESKP